MPDHPAAPAEVVDLFAGARGWDVGARELGLDPLGIELNEDACATSEAAGFRTLRADVAALDPTTFAPCEGLIASPPCPSFSRAGKRLGLKDMPIIIECVQRFLAGEDPRLQAWHDERSALTLESLRWALALKPRWLAFEQVPDVLWLWEHFAIALQRVGYMTWTGLLSAECYGVPQTRERAFLLASLDMQPHAPPPTHQRYDSRAPRSDDLFGDLLPWVSMAEALGWGMTTRPSVSVTAGGSQQGGHDPLDGGSGARETLKREREAGKWLQTDARRNAARRNGNQPSSTLKFGNAPTDSGWRDGTENGTTPAERLTEQEAAILQGFPPDYPWQGSRTARFLQIGNAICPAVAKACLSVVVSARGPALQEDQDSRPHGEPPSLRLRAGAWADSRRHAGTPSQRRSI